MRSEPTPPSSNPDDKFPEFYRVKRSVATCVSEAKKLIQSAMASLKRGDHDVEDELMQAFMELEGLDVITNKNLLEMEHDIVIWPNGITGVTDEQMKEREQALINERFAANMDHDRGIPVCDSAMQELKPSPTTPTMLAVRDIYLDPEVIASSPASPLLPSQESLPETIVQARAGGSDDHANAIYSDPDFQVGADFMDDNDEFQNVLESQNPFCNPLGDTIAFADTLVDNRAP